MNFLADFTFLRLSLGCFGEQKTPRYCCAAVTCFGRKKYEAKSGKSLVAFLSFTITYVTDMTFFNHMKQ